MYFCTVGYVFIEIKASFFFLDKKIKASLLQIICLWSPSWRTRRPWNGKLKPIVIISLNWIEWRGILATFWETILRYHTHKITCETPLPTGNYPYKFLCLIDGKNFLLFGSVYLLLMPDHMIIFHKAIWSPSHHHCERCNNLFNEHSAWSIWSLNI